MNIKTMFNNAVGAIIEKQDDLTGVDDISLIFSTITSHNVNLQSNITDYWLEDQTAIQDSIGLHPIQISLSGLVGEIEYTNRSYFGDSLIGKLNQLSKETLGFELTNKLTAIGSLAPEVDNYTQTAKEVVKQVENVYNNVKGKISKFFGNKTELKQTQRAKWLKNVWETKTALKVTTPFGVFRNMYILTAPMIQEETNTVSKISVTLKQLRFTGEIDADEAVIKAGINKICSADMVDNGLMKTETVMETTFRESFA